MKYNIQARDIKKNLADRIATNKAELQALKQVKVNTKHNKLTNRAIENATVFNYIDINKAVRVSFSVEMPDGHTSYKSREITAYSYTDEKGNELGVEDNGFTRKSRTITPTEFNIILQDIKDGLASNIGELESEYERAVEITQEHNKLVEQINKFNNSVSYASKAQI